MIPKRVPQDYRYLVKKSHGKICLEKFYSKIKQISLL